MTFLEWLSSSIGTGLLLALLGFLARRWIIERLANSIKYEYETELETHKANLKRDYDVQVEQLRAQLQIDAAERNLRFSRIFARTAETIVTTYQKLVELKDAVTSSTMLFEGLDETQKKELAKLVNERWKEFESFYKQNKIYIPKCTAEKIREFSFTLSIYETTYRSLVALEKSQGTNYSVVERHYQEIKKLQEKLPALLTTLEDEFQKVLGFPIEEKPAKQ